MNFLGKDTQVTQAGQAIKINSLAASALKDLFSTNIGPFGNLKMLITPANDVSLTKDGTTICKDVQFSHPLSRLVSSSALNLSQVIGDGISTFVFLFSEILITSVSYYNDGTSVNKICNGIQSALKDILTYLDSVKISVDDESSEELIKSLLYTSLVTKVDKDVALKFSEFVFSGLKNIKSDEKFDTNMIEVIKMGEGDPEDSLFIQGLVLDHGNRHPIMPIYVEDCAIMIGNISLEYEKPEVNAQFNYSTADQRDELVASERKFIFDRAMAVANFSKEVKQRTGKTLVLINEKGIDPISLEVLANAGVLALRRAKRRNMERLVKMCGGNIIAREEQLNIDNLGYCQRVRVESFGDEKYTFIEGAPFQGSCTILIKGNTSYEIERIESAVKGSIKSLSHVIRDRVCLKGGKFLLSRITNFLEKKIKDVDEKNVIGYKVMKKSFLNLAKNLIRNEGGNIEENIIKIERGEVIDEKVIDNYCVITKVIANACVLSVNLLMVDDIIKAGKPLKEEENKTGN